MFHFYDSKGDGVIDFEEFVVGVSYTNNKIKTTEKLKRIFQGYDLDGDGYVERKDFLRMFKAFYSLSKVLTRDTVGSLGDELYDPENIDRAPSGRQPISAVFTATIPGIGRSWAKPATLSEFDDEDTDSSVVLDGSYNAVDPKDSGNFRNSGATDPSEIARRNDFWAFDDTEETEGLLMLTDEESDVGSEVLYHMALRGINELLDLIFKEKEKAAIEARHEGGKKGHGKSPEPINNNSEEPSPTEASGTPVAEALSKEGEPDSPANREEREKDRHAAVREMAKQRGGEGRLNFEEFTKIMNGSNSKRLEFVGSWMDLASF